VNEAKAHVGALVHQGRGQLNRIVPGSVAAHLQMQTAALLAKKSEERPVRFEPFDNLMQHIFRTVV